MLSAIVSSLAQLTVIPRRFCTMYTISFWCQSNVSAPVPQLLNASVYFVSTDGAAFTTGFGQQVVSVAGAVPVFAGVDAGVDAGVEFEAPVPQAASASESARARTIASTILAVFPLFIIMHSS